MKLWQSLGGTDQPKTKTKKTGRRQRHGSVWRGKKERSNERKRINLKKQKWVWSGNPGGTSVTVTVWK